MVLNYIWICFFIVSFVVCLFKAVFMGEMAIFETVMNSTISAAKTGFEISLGLTGVLAFWMGLMKIGEEAGVIRFFSKLLNPVLSKLFPQIPKNHPAYGSIFMNFSANMLGLDNAATPLGLKAMQQLQELNDQKDTASNAMIMFLVLNTSGLTIIPINIMVYRAQLGAANPSDIFLPILIATFCSSLAGMMAICIKQKISLLQKNLVLFIIGLLSFLIGLVYFFSTLEKEQITAYSSLMANLILMSIIIGFIVGGMWKKINLYQSFVEGAKGGFQTAISIIPHLIAILVGVAAFRASGALDYIISALSATFNLLGINAEWIGALPTALMKPLSGSGARGMMIETMQTYGADSFVGKVASTIQGSTETTFYILAVYFGSVGIKKYRYALPYGLFADAIGIISAILLCYLFF